MSKLPKANGLASSQAPSSRFSQCADDRSTWLAGIVPDGCSLCGVRAGGFGAPPSCARGLRASTPSAATSALSRWLALYQPTGSFLSASSMTGKVARS
ncbi:MAG: hypothetical protein ACJ8G1_08815, partial [Vitreoscilla sp.]